MSVRSRSRSPMRRDDDQIDGEPRYLFIGNLPPGWRFYKIKQFIVEHYFTDLDVIEDMGHIHLLTDSIGEYKGECLIEFESVECCQKAMMSLRGAECQGKKLIVMTDTGKLLPAFIRPKPKAKQQPPEGPSKKQQKQNYGPPPMDDDESQYGHKRTFGLSKEFLDRLGIQPPLHCRVFVGNLASQVTETKLREVFSMAGEIVTAKRHQNWGKIVYDHPVEAVQAISMFHGQILHNSKMIVQLDTSKYSSILPDGLAGVGDGLAANGKPMRAVRLTFELQPLKQLLQLELAKQHQQADSDQQNLMLNANTNQAQNNPLATLLQLLQQQVDGGAASINLQAALQGNPAFNQNLLNIQSQHTPASKFDIPPSPFGLAVNPLNAMNAIVKAAQNPLANIMANAGQNPLANLQTALTNLQNANVGQSQAPRSRFDIPPSGMVMAPNAPAMAPNATAMAPNPLAIGSASSAGNQGWGAQNDWSNYQGASQNQPSGFDNGGYGSFQHNPDEFDVQRLSDLNKSEDKMKSSDMLLFQNLPPSVTSKALVNKMREVGELLFAEMTGQGRAVVRFQDARDAQRCVKLYDRSKVDGQEITVKMF